MHWTPFHSFATLVLVRCHIDRRHDEGDIAYSRAMLAEAEGRLPSQLPMRKEIHQIFRQVHTNTVEGRSCRMNVRGPPRHAELTLRRRLFDPHGCIGRDDDDDDGWTCRESRLRPGENRWDDHLEQLEHVNPPTVGKLRMLFILAAFNNTPLDERFRFEWTDSQRVHQNLHNKWSPPMPMPNFPGFSNHSNSTRPHFTDAAHHADQWFRAQSNGQLSLDWTYVRVVLKQDKPAESAHENFQ